MDVAKKAAELKALLKGMKDDDTEEMDEDEEVCFSSYTCINTLYMCVSIVYVCLSLGSRGS